MALLFTFERTACNRWRITSEYVESIALELHQLFRVFRKKKDDEKNNEKIPNPMIDLVDDDRVVTTIVLVCFELRSSQNIFCQSVVYSFKREMNYFKFEI